MHGFREGRQPSNNPSNTALSREYTESRFFTITVFINCENACMKCSAYVCRKHLQPLLTKLYQCALNIFFNSSNWIQVNKFLILCSFNHHISLGLTAIDHNACALHSFCTMIWYHQYMTICFINSCMCPSPVQSGCDPQLHDAPRLSTGINNILWCLHTSHTMQLAHYSIIQLGTNLWVGGSRRQ